MSETQHTESLSRSIALWREAWLALPDNPLYNYVRLSNHRRGSRLPAARRIIGYVLIIVAVLGLGAAIFGANGAFGNVPTIDWVVPALMFVSGMLYLTWLANGIAIAARDGLSVLSLPGRRAISLQMDDMLCITRLSSRDIVLAGVMNSVLVLQPRVIGGAVLVMLDVFAVLLLNNSEVDSIFAALLLSPVTVGCMVLSGSLAVLLTALGLIIAGRGLSADRLGSLSALFLLMGNIVWIGMSFALVAGGPDITEDPVGTALAQALGFALVLLSFYGVHSLAQRLGWMRAFYAAIGPMILPLILVVSVLVYGALQYYLSLIGQSFIWDTGLSSNAAAELAFAYTSAWGAFAIVNPLVIPHQWCLGAYNADTQGMASLWTHLPATLLVQFGLLLIFAHFALRAVDLRRRNA